MSMTIIKQVNGCIGHYNSIDEATHDPLLNVNRVASVRRVT